MPSYSLGARAGRAAQLYAFSSPGKPYSFPGPAKTPHEPQPMLFKAVRRHQYWTVDVRYIDHKLDDPNVYGISIPESTDGGP